MKPVDHVLLVCLMPVSGALVIDPPDGSRIPIVLVGPPPFDGPAKTSSFRSTARDVSGALYVPVPSFIGARVPLPVPVEVIFHWSPPICEAVTDGLAVKLR